VVLIVLFSAEKDQKARYNTRRIASVGVQPGFFTTIRGDQSGRRILRETIFDSRRSQHDDVFNEFLDRRRTDSRSILLNFDLIGHSTIKTGKCRSTQYNVLDTANV
jgi:hypothetical protein